jgi:hypothetical protein
VIVTDVLFRESREPLLRNSYVNFQNLKAVTEAYLLTLDTVTEAVQQRAKTQPSPSSTVPFHRDPHFVDRPELNDLEERLHEAGKRVALVGLGGVGYEMCGSYYVSRKLMI